MRRLRIGILDLVTKSPNPSLYGRVMYANLASIMPQVVGVWCEQEGHQVQFVCYTGMEDLLPAKTLQRNDEQDMHGAITGIRRSLLSAGQGA